MKKYKVLLQVFPVMLCWLLLISVLLFQNEESHFRHFIRGFVAIWESQLKLDWTNSERLPDCTNVKDDFGPHLSRLPEELLPAIGKFIFIAKDNSEKVMYTFIEKLVFVLLSPVMLRAIFLLYLYFFHVGCNHSLYYKSLYQLSVFNVE